METHFVYITCGSKEDARRIGRAIVEQRLAACANILDGMEAIYHWQGQIEQEQECVLIFKTTAAHYSALEKAVLALHPYDVPCIIALPILMGHKAYLDWIQSEAGNCKI
ncbi:MAG: divalent-cation tolerance protein CutA [Bacteroidota bacterium]